MTVREFIERLKTLDEHSEQSIMDKQIRIGIIDNDGEFPARVYHSSEACGNNIVMANHVHSFYGDIESEYAKKQYPTDVGFVTVKFVRNLKGSEVKHD